MSQRDYRAKEEAQRRLSEPEGDHELHAALERMRKNHYHLCKALKKARENPAVVAEWRRA